MIKNKIDSVRVACVFVRVDSSRAISIDDMQMTASHLAQTYRAPISPPRAQNTQVFLSLADSLVCLCFHNHIRALSRSLSHALSHTHTHTHSLFFSCSFSLSLRNYHIYHTT